jgi:hypothetical protein
VSSPLVYAFDRLLILRYDVSGNILRRRNCLFSLWSFLADDYPQQFRTSARLFPVRLPEPNEHAVSPLSRIKDVDPAAGNAWRRFQGMNLPRQALDQPRWHTVLRYCLCYLTWLAFTGIGFALIFALRTNLFDLGAWLRFNPWQVRAMDQFAIFLLGMAWFAGILLLESYLRHGVERRQLWPRIARVGRALLVVTVFSYGLQWLI